MIRGYSLVVIHGLLVEVASLILLWNSGSRVCGLQQLWHKGLVALQHVGSSWLGIEPMSLALAGGFLTTGPPRNLEEFIFNSESHLLSSGKWLL